VDSPDGAEKVEYNFKFSVQVWFRLFGYVPYDRW